MTNQLTDRLREVTDDLPARLPGGAAVRAGARARQRHRRVIGGTALAAAVAVAAVTVGEDTVGDRLLPATDGSTSSPTASLSPEIKPPLAWFHFPEEATWRSTSTKVTVERSDDLGTPWLLDPCMPTAYPTDRHRVAMVSLTRTRSEGPWFEGRQLAVYPDEATAVKVMAGFRRAVAVCGRTDRSAVGGPTYSEQVPVDPGDEARLISDMSVLERREPASGRYTIVMRDGRSVYLASVEGPIFPTGPPDPVAIDLIAAASATVPLPQ